MIPAYRSLLWNTQLYGLGYFEMTVEASKENAALLKEGRMLVRESDIIDGGANGREYRDAMIIRRVAIVYDADLGYIMTVSGKSIKDILSQRIIWLPIEWGDTTLDTVMTTLVRMNATDPVNYVANFLRMANQELTGAENWQSAAETGLEDAQEALVDATEAYDQAVAEHGEDSPEAKAAKTAMDNAAAAVTTADEYLAEAKAAVLEATKKVDFYTWENTVAQLRAIPYFTDATIPLTNPPEISVQLHGENLGDWCQTIAEEYGLGWGIGLYENAMLFYFVLGTDRHTTVEFSPELDNLKNAEYARDLSIYRNAGLATGDGEGYHQVVADIGSSAGASRYEEFIATGLTKDEETSDTTYKKQVKQAGKSAITKLKKHETITGEIDTDGIYKIGDDFDLGDVVTIKLQQGITATTRLTEILYSDEADGTKTTGIFEEWEVS
jgi:soluble cytochrome b562